jgi:glycosyltransferase involved in cell wall biosynthesis
MPHLARAASPGLADALAAELANPRFQELHVMRSYLAPLGVAVAERLGIEGRTLDLDDDDAAVVRSQGAGTAEAAGYERLIDVFGGLYGRVCAASAVEAAALSTRHSLAVEHIPNAIELPARLARAPRSAALRLLFVGNLNYAPNVEAAKLLVHELLPLLGPRLRGRQVEVTLAGGAEAEVRRLAGPGVRVTGFVEDLRPLYAQADVVVAPLQTGGGTRIKLIEAFGYGVPVVATPAAAAGLAVAHGVHLLLGGDAEELARGVSELAGDEALGERLAGAAETLVRERYSLEAVLPRVRSFLVGAGSGRGAPQAALSP